MTATLVEHDVTTLEDRLRSRIEALKENRERFIAEAQRNLAALDGAIGELEALLNPAPAGLNGASDAEVT